MTASRPDTALPIDVDGELRLDGPSGRPVALTARGSQLSLAVAGWANLNEFGPGSLRARRRALATAIKALRVLRLRLDVAVGGERAFGIGEGVKTTLLARLFGLPSTDLRVSNLVSLMRSRAAARRASRR